MVQIEDIKTILLRYYNATRPVLRVKHIPSGEPNSEESAAIVLSIFISTIYRSELIEEIKQNAVRYIFVNSEIENPFQEMYIHRNFTRLYFSKLDGSTVQAIRLFTEPQLMFIALFPHLFLPINNRKNLSDNINSNRFLGYHEINLYEEFLKKRFFESNKYILNYAAARLSQKDLELFSS